MSEQAFLTLYHLSVQFCLSLIGLFALRPLLRRGFGANCAYLAWLLLPLLLVTAQLPASRSSQVLQTRMIQSFPTALSTSVAQLAPASDWISTWSQPLLVLWLLGAGACIAVLALRQRRFMRGLQLHTDGSTWQGPAGSGPALVGLWQPRLCLPADFEQRFSPEQQRLIVAHEQVHRQRCDNAWNLLALALCALQWFNPLAWLGLRAMRVDQELSCDAAVLRAEPAQAADYARALLNAQGSALLGLPWASWRSAHPLIERIAMLKFHANARRRTGLFALTLLSMTGAAAVHALESKPAIGGASIPNGDVHLVMSFQYFAPRAESGSPGQKSRSLQIVDIAQGKPYHLVLPDSANQHVEVTVTAVPFADNSWDIKLQVDRGQPSQALLWPRLIVASGTGGTIDVDNQDGSEFIAFIAPTTLRDGKLVPYAPQ